MTEGVERAADIIAGAKGVTVLTGAGISVESGIPDFRSKGGLWTRFPPEEYATISAFRRDPEKVWRMLAEMEKVLDAASPNPAHRALAEMELRGLVGGIVTQNIDGLHQAAGSKKVVEFHGSHTTLSCLSCGAAMNRLQARSLPQPPRCGCGAIVKPDVIFFGEMIPPQALLTAQELSSGCGAMLVIGTSAEVAPASQMPALAKRSGAKVIEINLERTMLTATVTDVFIRGKAGESLPALLEAL